MNLNDIVMCAAQSSGGYPFVNSEAAAVVARMTTQPGNTRKALIDTLVGALKAGGSWAKRDALYVIAAADNQAARLNWISTSFTLSAISSPSFTADRGYTGDGTAAYLTTGMARNALTFFTQNSANIAAWSRTELNAVSYLIGTAGGGVLRMTPRAAGLLSGRINDAVQIQPSIASSIGLSSVNRSGSALRQIYKNGAEAANDTQASTAIDADTITLLRDGAGTFAARNIAFAAVGGSLTAGESLAEYNAVAAYMTAIGA